MIVLRIAMKRVHVVALCGLVLLALHGVVVLADGDTAIYWSLEREGKPAGYLLGTIHSEDPRVLDFSAAFAGRLAGNDFFAMEIVPDFPTLDRLTKYMQYSDGSTLESRIGPDRFARVHAALAGYQIPEDWVARLKVWAVVMTLSVPPPKTGLFMDFSLSLRAAGAGLKVVGLETLEQQLEFLEQMPLPEQISLLDQALDDHGKVEEVHRALVDSYLSGDLEALARLADEQMSRLDPEARRHFVEQGIEARNRRMLASLLPYLANGRVFVAVGAMHLPGRNGLISLLRENGYELEPLPLPFSAPE